MSSSPLHLREQATESPAPAIPPLCINRPPQGLIHNERFGDPDASGAIPSL
jgi:hypothetical protein